MSSQPRKEEMREAEAGRSGREARPSAREESKSRGFTRPSLGLNGSSDSLHGDDVKEPSPPGSSVFRVGDRWEEGSPFSASGSFLATTRAFAFLDAVKEELKRQFASDNFRNVATQIQKCFRAFKGRTKAKEECLWRAWNELDKKEESELRDSYAAYEALLLEAKKKAGQSVGDGPHAINDRESCKHAFEALALEEVAVSNKKSARHANQQLLDRPPVALPRQPSMLEAPDMPTPLTFEYIKQLIIYLEFGYTMPRADLQALLQVVTLLVTDLPNVVAVNVHSRFTIVGDIHGQLMDLLHIFELNGYPSPRNQYLFNGDIVDRGQNSLECIAVIFAFKMLYPEFVYINRGNHEARDINSRDGFEKECITKYDSKIFDLFSATFAALPIAHVINGKIFVVHGGLCREDVTIAKLNEIKRFNEFPGAVPLLEDCLWSDPAPENGRSESRRGAGIHFGRDVVERFLRMNDMKLIVRSHECKREGFEWMYDGRLLTIFSASNYCGRVGNEGAVLVLTAELAKVLVTFYAGEREKRPSKKAADLETEIARKLAHRIGANRLKLIAELAKVEDAKTRTVTRVQWTTALRDVLGLDIPYAQLGELLGVPKLGMKGNQAEKRVDYMAVLSQYRPTHQRFLHAVPDPRGPSRSPSGDLSEAQVPESQRRESSAKKMARRQTMNASEVKAIEEMETFLMVNRYELEALFRFFDQNGDETISVEEFIDGIASLCAVLRQPWDRELTKRIVHAFDLDKDGVIDFQEFFNAFDVSPPGKPLPAPSPPPAARSAGKSSGVH